jgi:hypothetical protein
VAVPQELGEPRFKSGLNNERMTTHKPAKDLLADDDVATWYANLEEGSVITSGTYLRRLNRFCEEFDTSPQVLAAMSSKDAHKLLVNVVRHYRSRNLAGSTISGYVKPIRSWLQHNEVNITQKVKIDGAHSTPRWLLESSRLLFIEYHDGWNCWSDLGTMHGSRLLVM